MARPIPGFVEIFYHSPFAPHKMTLPTRQASYAAVGDDPTYLAWDGSTVASGVAMVNALITDLRGYMPVDQEVDYFVIWDNLPTYTRPKPIKTYQVGLPGLNETLEGWAQAVQRTYTLQTENFGISKLVLLDSPTNNNFGKYYDVGPLEDDILNNLTDSTKAWQGRDGFRPAVFKNLTITLNEKLRREYHLT